MTIAADGPDVVTAGGQSHPPLAGIWPRESNGTRGGSFWVEGPIISRFAADGAKGRKIDKLVWERSDLEGDGTHPSESGRMKVARMLLEFFANDPLAKTWFAAQPAG